MCGLSVLLGEPGSNTSKNKENTSDLNESTKGPNAAHDIQKVLEIIAVGVAETSRVDK